MLTQYFLENCDLCNLVLSMRDIDEAKKITKLEDNKIRRGVRFFKKKWLRQDMGWKNRFSSNIVQHISVSQRRIQDFPGAPTPTFYSAKIPRKLHENERGDVSKMLPCRSATVNK